MVDIDLRWISELPDCVALMTLGVEQNEAEAAIGLLRKMGVTVSIGHTRATEQEFLLALGVIRSMHSLGVIVAGIFSSLLSVVGFTCSQITYGYLPYIVLHHHPRPCADLHALCRGHPVLGLPIT